MTRKEFKQKARELVDGLRPDQLMHTIPNQLIAQRRPRRNGTGCLLQRIFNDYSYEAYCIGFEELFWDYFEIDVDYFYKLNDEYVRYQGPSSKVKLLDAIDSLPD